MNGILSHPSRLRTLLQSEEEQYTTEMAGQQETVLERQAKMRERAKMLRERKEAERLALVEKSWTNGGSRSMYMYVIQLVLSHVRPNMIMNS